MEGGWIVLDEREERLDPVLEIVRGDRVAEERAGDGIDRGGSGSGGSGGG